MPADPSRMSCVGANGFKNWLTVAKPGDKLCYAWGNNTFAYMQTVLGRNVAGETFDNVWQAFENREVMLFQKRAAGNLTEYWAVRTRAKTHETIDRIANGECNAKYYHSIPAPGRNPKDR